MAVRTREQLARQLAAHAGISGTAAREELRCFFDTLSQALANGQEGRIHGFGRFHAR
jgi:nucleoid DNA-binding protein